VNLPKVGSGAPVNSKSRSGAAVSYVSSNVHGVPMGMIESPLLFSEIVPDAASEKRPARAGIAVRDRKINKRRAAVVQRAVIAMTVLKFWLFDVGGPFVAGAISFLTYGIRPPKYIVVHLRASKDHSLSMCPIA
jgi:hypothetical protein